MGVAKEDSQGSLFSYIHPVLVVMSSLQTDSVKDSRVRADLSDGVRAEHPL